MDTDRTQPATTPAGHGAGSQHPGGQDVSHRHCRGNSPECSGPAAGPDPLGNSALRQTSAPWIDLVQNICLAVFAADFVLHLALVEKPRRYLFSFTGLIDASAVLFFLRTASAR